MKDFHMHGFTYEVSHVEGFNMNSHVEFDVENIFTSNHMDSRAKRHIKISILHI